MKRVICIDPGNKALCLSYGMEPLKAGETYTVRAETKQPRGPGYLLNEIHNRCNIIGHPGVEPSYLQSRFITVEERERITTWVLEELEKI